MKNFGKYQSIFYQQNTNQGLIDNNNGQQIKEENCIEDNQYFEFQIQNTYNSQKNGNSFIKNETIKKKQKDKFLFNNFQKYQEYMLQQIGSHDTGSILKQFKNNINDRNNIIIKQEPEVQICFGDYKTDMDQSQQNQDGYDYNSIIFQQTEDKSVQQMINNDFRTYYYEQSQIKLNKIKSQEHKNSDNFDFDDSQNISQKSNKSQLKQQTLNIYDIKIFYFQNHYKFKQYVTSIYDKKEKFNQQDLVDTKFYYSENENVINFIEVLNNQNYNRIFIDYIIKVYEFKFTNSESQYNTFQMNQKQISNINLDFFAIRYKNKQNFQSVMMIQLQSDQIKNLFKNIFSSKDIKLQKYTQERFILSKENSFEADKPQQKQFGNQKKIQERNQTDRTADQVYEDYLGSISNQKDESMKLQRMQSIKIMPSLKKMPSIAFVSSNNNHQLSQDVLNQYATPTLLNQEQLDKLQTYEKSQRQFNYNDTSIPHQSHEQDQLQGFIQQQLVQQGYKIITNKQTQGPDGFYYNLDEFKQNPDGYIYGPKVQMIKNGNQEVETIQEQIVAAGIYKQNHEGDLFGPDGQNYGPREQVMQIAKQKESTTLRRQNSQDSNKSTVSVNQMDVSVINNPESAEKKEEFQANLQKSIENLQAGLIFIKYGSGNFFSGSKRKVFVDSTLRYLCWTKNLNTEKIINKQMDDKGNWIEKQQEKGKEQEKEQEKTYEQQQEKSKEKEKEQEKGKEKQQEQDEDQNSNNKENVNYEEGKEGNQNTINGDEPKIVDKSIFEINDNSQQQKQNKQLQEELKYTIVDGKNRIIKKLFEIKRILSIVNGRQTKNYKRFSTKDQDRLDNSFSILLKQRSIDLEALNKQDKQDFIKALIFLISNVDHKKMEQSNPKIFQHMAGSSQVQILKKK